MKFLVLVILSFFALTFAKNRVILDKNLHKFRQEYREFKWVTKILTDKSFFEVYNAVGVELKEVEESMVDIYDSWKQWSLKFNETSLQLQASEKFRVLNENVRDLLDGASKVHQKGLNEIFSGDLMSPSPPMEYLEDLFDEIEFHVEDVWEFYSNNSVCVALMFKKFLPLFDPIVEKIIKLGKTTKEDVKTNYFKKSKSSALEASKYVEYLKEKMDECTNVKDIDTCVLKLVSFTCIKNELNTHRESVDDLSTIKK